MNNQFNYCVHVGRLLKCGIEDVQLSFDFELLNNFLERLFYFPLVLCEILIGISLIGTYWSESLIDRN